MSKRLPRVTVGWRVMAMLEQPAGHKALQAISRVFHAKQAAMDFREQAIRDGHTDAYVQSVERPERKVPDLVDGL